MDILGAAASTAKIVDTASNIIGDSFKYNGERLVINLRKARDGKYKRLYIKVYNLSNKDIRSIEIFDIQNNRIVGPMVLRANDCHEECIADNRGLWYADRLYSVCKNTEYSGNQKFTAIYDGKKVDKEFDVESL